MKNQSPLFLFAYPAYKFYFLKPQLQYSEGLNPSLQEKFQIFNFRLSYFQECKPATCLSIRQVASFKRQTKVISLSLQTLVGVNYTKVGKLKVANISLLILEKVDPGIQP